MPNAANAGIVVVGGSHAATQVAHVLRRLRQPGKITVISEEPVLPYHRPSLSKEFLKGNKTFDQILIRQEAMYAKANIDLVLGRRAVSVDRGRKTVGLDDGEVLDYTKLVLALGAQPRRLPIPGTDLDGVCYVRTVADIENMFAMISPGERAIVIGGGYIGLEAAASLRSLQMDVTVLESQERVLQRVTSPLMSEFFTRVHREEGVQIRVDESISEIVGSGRVSGVVLGNGQVEPASLVVVGIGIEPNIGLAENAGLAISNGIVVNEFGQTEDPDIYAAGDCTNFVHPRYQRAMRLESVQNANDQLWLWLSQFPVRRSRIARCRGSGPISLM